MLDSWRSFVWQIYYKWEHTHLNILPAVPVCSVRGVRGSALGRLQLIQVSDARCGCEGRGPCRGMEEGNADKHKNKHK